VKKLLKVALVVAGVTAVAKLVTAKKAEWHGLTESQVREKLDSRLPGRSGVLREQNEATAPAPAEEGGTAADSGDDAEDNTESV
jgi:hypothetical protein